MSDKQSYERIQELAKKWKEGTITAEEENEFNQWYNAEDLDGLSDKEDAGLRERIFRVIAEREGLWGKKGRQDESGVGEGGLSRMQRGDSCVQRDGSRVRSLKTWLAAAAILIVLFGVGLFFRERNSLQAPLATTTHHPQRENVLPPGSTKATLTLSDGTVVPLEQGPDGTIRDKGGIDIQKSQGQIVYQEPATEEPVSYNTITVPRGGQYKLILSDGTGVWLNSASSLRYPTVFRGDKRSVTLRGEAYFEVTKDKAHRFEVISGDQVIDVLGTQFNINSYEDEKCTRTTLLEGSVRVGLPDQSDSLVIRPGQQSVLKEGTGRWTVIDNADLEQAVAWKNGYFQINDADIETIMRQVARWYDVDVVYEGKVPVRQLSGKMRRSASASQFLDMLSYFNIHFRIEGRTIVVMA